MDVFGITEAHFFVFMLILLRVGSLFAFAPIFSSPFVPVRVKAAAVLGLSLGLTVLGAAPAVAVPSTVSGVVGMSAQEVVLGAVIGLVARFVFAAIQFGGQLVGLQMGLGIVSVMDPQFETQISVVSQLEFILAILLFLAVGGDRMMLEAFVHNLAVAPPGHVVVSGALVEGVTRLSGDVFRIGLQVAAPVVAAQFSAQVILGVFARSVPQMNMLILGFPLQIMVGFGVLGLSLPHWGRTVLTVLQQTFRALEGLGNLMG